MPEYRDVPYQVITTSRATLESQAPVVAARCARDDQGDEVRSREQGRNAARVRQYFQDTPEAEFNAAFDSYISAMPTTPVISQAQVDSTVRMVNLTEKTPMHGHLRSVRVRRPVAREQPRTCWGSSMTRRIDPIAVWQVAVGVLLLAGWEAIGRLTGSRMDQPARA